MPSSVRAGAKPKWTMRNQLWFVKTANLSVLLPALQLHLLGCIERIRNVKAFSSWQSLQNWCRQVILVDGWGVSWPSGSPSLLHWKLQLLLPILPYALQFYRAQRLSSVNRFIFIDWWKILDRFWKSVCFVLFHFVSICFLGFFLAERRQVWLEDFDPKTVRFTGETQWGERKEKHNGETQRGNTTGKWYKVNK